MNSDLPIDEARVREALGVSEAKRTPRNAQVGHLPHRRRFVRDGEVPVVVVNASAPHDSAAPSGQDRLAAAEEALGAERQSHARTERALKDAVATIRALETKLAHAELAYTEAVQSERCAREQAELMLQELRARVQPKEEGRDSGKPSAPTQKSRKGMRPKRRTEGTGRLGNMPRDGQSDQEPVQWWLPSFRAKRRR